MDMRTDGGETVNAGPPPVRSVYLDAYLAPFQPWLARQSVTEILVNRPGELWIEDGEQPGMQRIAVPAIDDRLLQRLAEQVARTSHQGINREHPLLAATLPGGERIQLCGPPATRSGWALAIRRHRTLDLPLEAYDRGPIVPRPEPPLPDPLMQPIAFLREAILRRQTILISGGTSTGKTTFLNAMLSEIPDTERVVLVEDTAELRLPGDARKPVVVAGQPIEIGEEPCMLFTFVDLEPRRRAEASLRLSEDRFRKAFRMLPVPSAVLRADDLEILDVNEAFCVATDCRAEDLVGPRGARVSAWLDPFVQAVVQHLARHASMRNVDLRIDFGNGEPLNCLVSAERVTIDGQACLLLTWLDITERRRSEMELVDAIELVLQDTSWFSRSLVEKLANVRRSGAIASRIGIDDLTAREQQVLEALSQGHSDKEIAKRLDVALGTVRNHVARIYTKIGVHSRNAALLWARDRGHFPTRTRGAGGRDN